jgi:signal transduction histidine kinase
MGILQHIATSRFRHGIAKCLVGGLALASLTVVCYRLRFNVATAALLYVIVVVLLSRTGNFVSSIFVSIIAARSLAYIAPPAYSFRVDDPLDDVAIMAFLVTSLVIASLVSKLHNAAEEALSSVNRRLIESEERERARIARELHDDIGQRLALLTNELEQL